MGLEAGQIRPHRERQSGARRSFTADRELTPRAMRALTYSPTANRRKRSARERPHDTLRKDSVGGLDFVRMQNASDVAFTFQQRCLMRSIDLGNKKVVDRYLDRISEHDARVSLAAISQN